MCGRFLSGKDKYRAHLFNIERGGFMIVLEKKVKGKQEELLKKAKAFFGPEGEGLPL
jgi:hypothetical protein